MLGKLIKYDLKSMNRILIIVHGFLLLMAVLLRIALSSLTLDVEASQILFGLTVLLYTIAITGITFATSIVIAVRFYRNLFSDEGYLSQTLPVTTGQHLLAKTISGTIWAFLDYCFILLALFIGIATRDVMQTLSQNKAEIYRILSLPSDLTITRLILILLALGLIGCVCNVITYYASVVLGQLFPSHRVVGAVACYFGLSTVISILSFAMITVIELTHGSSFLLLDATDELIALNVWDYMWTITLYGISLSLIFCIILYVLSYYLMKRRLDLN